MSKFKVGWILFPKKDEDFWSSVEKYRSFGYAGMEMGEIILGQADASPEENLSRFKGLGLEVAAVGANQLLTYDEAKIDEVIARAKLTGAKFATCYISSAINPLMGKPECDSDTYFKEIEALERAAERMAKSGVKLCYHNHNFEFLRLFGGISAFDQMVSRTSTLCFEPDVGWVTKAGEDPVKLLDRLGDRVAAVHFKDFVPWAPGKEARLPDFTAVGCGVVNIAAVAEWTANKGLEWGVVEQDTLHNLGSAESLQCSYLNLKETGFAI